MFGTMDTEIEVALSTVTSCKSYPTKLKTSVDPFSAEIVNFPVASVVVPLVVPLINMLTPGSGS
jgi:hypothetical protein